MNLVEHAFETARRLDLWSEPAILCGDRRLTYSELLDAARRFGGALRVRGIEPGDRVVIVARDCPAFVVAFFGTIAAGAIAVPLSTMLSAEETRALVEHCGARAAVVSDDQTEKLQGATGLDSLLVIGDALDAEVAAATGCEVRPADDDALAFMLYSSGSTGRPKGATHRHADIRHTVDTYCRSVLDVGPGDRLYSASKLFFAYGLGNGLSFPLSTGATSVLSGDRPSPTVVAGVFERHRPTVFFGVPAVFRALVDHAASGGRLDTTSIRFCVSAGERLPERTHVEWRDLTGLEILDGIGSTEMLHIFISNRPGDVVPGSSGTLVPGYEARLVDPSGAEISGEGSGHLFVRGASASHGYWHDPEKTAETMVDGWMATGDVYRREADGRFWHEGRSDDLFKVKGLWVSPLQVEEALLACPGVAEAAVVAGTDAHGDGIAVAYVVLAPECGTDAVDSRVRSRLPAFKCPSEYRVIDALPRTATGKVQRFKLRAG